MRVTVVAPAPAFPCFFFFLIVNFVTTKKKEKKKSTDASYCSNYSNSHLCFSYIVIISSSPTLLPLSFSKNNNITIDNLCNGRPDTLPVLLRTKDSNLSRNILSPRQRPFWISVLQSYRRRVRGRTRQRRNSLLDLLLPDEELAMATRSKMYSAIYRRIDEGRKMEDVIMLVT